MTEALEKAEMEGLCKLPAFRNFLRRTSIQMAGLLDYKPPQANGSDSRNLEYHEGRRSLGLETLRDAARGMPVDDQDDAALKLLMIQILREDLQTAPEEKPSGRRNRYDDLDDGSDDAD